MIVSFRLAAGVWEGGNAEGIVCGNLGREQFREIALAGAFCTAANAGTIKGGLPIIIGLDCGAIQRSDGGSRHGVVSLRLDDCKAGEAGEKRQHGDGV
jgi:hypothetical protein